MLQPWIASVRCLRLSHMTVCSPWMKLQRQVCPLVNHVCCHLCQLLIIPLIGGKQGLIKACMISLCYDSNGIVAAVQDTSCGQRRREASLGSRDIAIAYRQGHKTYIKLVVKSKKVLCKVVFRHD